MANRNSDTGSQTPDSKLQVSGVPEDDKNPPQAVRKTGSIGMWVFLNKLFADYVQLFEMKDFRSNISSSLSKLITIIILIHLLLLSFLCHSNSKYSAF